MAAPAELSVGGAIASKAHEARSPRSLASARSVALHRDRRKAHGGGGDTLSATKWRPRCQTNDIARRAESTLSTLPDGDRLSQSGSIASSPSRVSLRRLGRAAPF